MEMARQLGRRSTRIVVSAVIAAASVSVGFADAVFVPEEQLAAGAQVAVFSRPAVLNTPVADVLVRVRGGANCSGTPILGGTLVVTAAHCVIDDNGQVAASRTVVRDGESYKPAAVLVNRQYHDLRRVRLDAAVLVMSEAIPGATADLGERLPDTGLATVAGMQPLDSGGSLLRGTRYDNRPHLRPASGSIVEIETSAAGCVGPAAALQVSTARVKVPCGLIPGASGGGLFVGAAERPTLVGVISTVAYDLTYNEVVPPTELRELLAHPDRYVHAMNVEMLASTRQSATRQ
jgi:hypothetical protein